MKMITAFVRTTSVEHIINSLKEIGVTGISVSEVKGVGEQVEIFKPYTIHNMIHIIAPEESVERISEMILRHAHTGFAGDGLLAVLPVDYAVTIRNREKIY